MKSKITINIDSELLNIIKDVSDSDLDTVFQDAVAQFLGVKQVWVKTNSLQPITSDSSTGPEPAPIIKNTVRRRRQPKFVLKIWDRLKEHLGEEFTTEDYWNATKKINLGYKDSARTSTIVEHLKLIEDAGKIIKTGDKGRYRKLEIEPKEGEAGREDKFGEGKFGEEDKEKDERKEILI